MVKHLLKNRKYNSRLKAAMSQANEAEKIPLETRLARFSFVARHKGNIRSPKQLKKSDINKYQRQFKRKFNIDFPIESSESDDDININDRDDTENENINNNNHNVIILGTPKRAKRQRYIPMNHDSGNERNVPAEKKNAMRNSEPQNLNTEESVVDKPPNSMLVQVGSTEAELSIDNGKNDLFICL